MSESELENQYTEEFLKEKYEQIKTNPIAIGIVSCFIVGHKSLKLQSFADLLDRKKNTVLHQVKNLLKEGYLEFDTDRMIEESGKYYKISDMTQALLDMRLEQTDDEFIEGNAKIDEIATMTMDQHFEYVAKQLKEREEEDVIEWGNLIVNINSFIQNIMLNKFENLLESTKNNDLPELKEIVKQSGLALGEFNLGQFSIPITNRDQMIRFIRLYYKQKQDLYQLKKEFIQENKENEPEFKPFNQYIYDFTAPIVDDE